MSRGRTTGPEGLVTALTRPTTAAEVAAVADPDQPWVLLSGFGPGLRGWTRARVPLVARQALEPVETTVRRLSFEVLLPTTEFLALAAQHGDDLAVNGVAFAQLRVRPGDDVEFGPGPVPVARYRAFGLVVAVDLPHAGECALLATLDDSRMDAALARLRAAGRG